MNHCPARLLHWLPFVPMGLVGNYYIYVLVDGARLAVTWVATQVFLSYCVIFILYQGQAKYLHSTAGRASPTKYELSHHIKRPRALLLAPWETLRCLWPQICHYTIEWHHSVGASGCVETEFKKKKDLCVCVRLVCQVQWTAPHTGREESHFLIRLWCRDSFPVIAVLERAGKGEKNMLFWKGSLCFG